MASLSHHPILLLKRSWQRSYQPVLQLGFPMMPYSCHLVLRQIFSWHNSHIIWTVWVNYDHQSPCFSHPMPTYLVLPIFLCGSFHEQKWSWEERKSKESTAVLPLHLKKPCHTCTSTRVMKYHQIKKSEWQWGRNVNFFMHTEVNHFT